jgi:hypothetical protein
VVLDGLDEALENIVFLNVLLVVDLEDQDFVILKTTEVAADLEVLLVQLGSVDVHDLLRLGYHLVVDLGDDSNQEIE